MASLHRLFLVYVPTLVLGLNEKDDIYNDVCLLQTRFHKTKTVVDEQPSNQSLGEATLARSSEGVALGFVSSVDNEDHVPSSSFLNKHQVNLDSPAPQDHDIEPEDYEKAYDHLYDNYGYHGDSEVTHEGPFVQELVEYQKMLPPKAPALHNVLVLGCSHGKGAELLHEHGFEAYGIDVAHRAIEMANKRNRTCAPGTEPCFVQGSLVKLPYGDARFDAGLSVDVLEHISPEDVPQVVNEISRVVRHYLFVQIASFKEMHQNGENAGMTNLHLTVEGAQWWKTAFARGGWKVTRDSSDGKYVNLVMEK